ncbi:MULTISPECIES: methylaspartate mutase subunit E [Haloarcula]|uniref:Glutamate mutase epsilon subunit n=1 Tax=Haloarcula pellucida TaxID=1427151 RepID=A0A830GI31_9EURY|nr:methylaspartate mutase subunit E [Halomicroarcula pellucida]MBX0346932.1 methylaspartate mutase subunit E [Halomicroarcula pellucida]QIO22393.1 methylaspartate mutase subunit E [Haloarcula sp. JP-L23]GGN86134.1 glutamate mutase [Halomicroarcula pellucida]
MLTDTKLDADELQHIANDLRDNWHTGRQVDFEEAIVFHESLPASKQFAPVLESADRPLLQPRAGVPLLEDQIDLLRYLQEEGGADLLPTTIDSYTRDNQYEKAEEGLAASRNGDTDELNGFPAVNHGVEDCRRLIRALDAPIEVRHGTPDARLLAMVTLAGGFQSFEGGPISYNIPYTKRHDLATTIEHWQFVDRLCGAYTERGVTINREPFGPLTGTLVPPCIAIAVMLVEGQLAATQGVRSITLGYGQVGNVVQDVAALRALRKLGEEFLPDSVTVTTVFHEWMGGFPPDEARANGVISLGGATAAVAKPDKVITKSPQEFQGVPTKEANASGLRTTRQLIDMMIEQDIDLNGIAEERELIERATRHLMDAIYEAGDGDVAQGVIEAFDSGAMDVPFAPSDAAAGAVLPARDDDGRVRIFEFADLALPDDIKETHKARLGERARTEGRDQSFRMVADDVDAISDGKLIGRPSGKQGGASDAD